MYIPILFKFMCSFQFYLKDKINIGIKYNIPVFNTKHIQNSNRNVRTRSQLIHSDTIKGRVFPENPYSFITMSLIKSNSTSKLT